MYYNDKKILKTYCIYIYPTPLDCLFLHFSIVIDVPILNGVDGVHFTFNKEGRPSGECFIEVATEADRDL